MGSDPCPPYIGKSSPPKKQQTTTYSRHYIPEFNIAEPWPSLHGQTTSPPPPPQKKMLTIFYSKIRATHPFPSMVFCKNRAAKTLWPRSLKALNRALGETNLDELSAFDVIIYQIFSLILLVLGKTANLFGNNKLFGNKEFWKKTRLCQSETNKSLLKKKLSENEVF